MNKKEIYKDIVLLILVNFVSQGFLLILSGTFWDDWAYVSHNVEQLWEGFLASGRPSKAIITEAVWWLPNYGYRTVAFALYLITSILFYFILNSIEIFGRKQALIMSILYITVPVNTIRLSLCTLDYAVGLTLFFIAFYLMTRYYYDRSKGGGTTDIYNNVFLFVVYTKCKFSFI